MLTFFNGSAFANVFAYKQTAGSSVIKNFGRNGFPRIGTELVGNAYQVPVESHRGNRKSQIEISVQVIGRVGIIDRFVKSHVANGRGSRIPPPYGRVGSLHSIVGKSFIRVVNAARDGINRQVGFLYRRRRLVYRQNRFEIIYFAVYPLQNVIPLRHSCHRKSRLDGIDPDYGLSVVLIFYGYVVGQARRFQRMGVPVVSDRFVGENHFCHIVNNGRNNHCYFSVFGQNIIFAETFATESKAVTYDVLARVDDGNGIFIARNFLPSVQFIIIGNRHVGKKGGFFFFRRKLKSESMGESVVTLRRGKIFSAFVRRLESKGFSVFGFGYRERVSHFRKRIIIYRIPRRHRKRRFYGISSRVGKIKGGAFVFTVNESYRHAFGELSVDARRHFADKTDGVALSHPHRNGTTVVNERSVVLPDKGIDEIGFLDTDFYFLIGRQIIIFQIFLARGKYRFENIRSAVYEGFFRRIYGKIIFQQNVFFFGGLTVNVILDVKSVGQIYYGNMRFAVVRKGRGFKISVRKFEIFFVYNQPCRQRSGSHVYRFVRLEISFCNISSAVGSGVVFVTDGHPFGKRSFQK